MIVVPPEKWDHEAGFRKMHQGKLLGKWSSGTGLVGFGKINFKLAKVSSTGKVHVVEYALVRWNKFPFPLVTYNVRCGGQHVRVFPVNDDCVMPEECCSRCFRVQRNR